MAEPDETKLYFNIPVEEFPPACQTCPTLARLAIAYGYIDLTRRSNPLSPSRDVDHLARFIFPRLGECATRTCGILTYALQSDSSLE